MWCIPANGTVLLDVEEVQLGIVWLGNWAVLYKLELLGSELLRSEWQVLGNLDAVHTSNH
jgi:hypothetical protein